MSPPTRLRAPHRREAPAGGRRKLLIRRTLAVVLLLSVSIHLLFLIGFGGTTLFPVQAPSFSFTSQNLAEASEEGPEGPAAEAEAPPETAPAEMPPPPMAAEEVVAVHETILVADATALAAPAAPSMAPAAMVSMETPVTRGGGGKPREGTGPSQAAPTFFGIPMDKKEVRVVLVLDTSNTMFERKREGKLFRFDFSVIKQEAANLIAGLTDDSSFNLVIYESGSQAYANQMVLATQSAKQQAANWILSLDEDPGMTIAKRPGPDENKLLEGRGTRLDTALKQTLGFKPTVVFVLTDGEVQRVEEGVFRWLGELRKLRPAAEIHVVQYLTEKTKDEETAILRRIAIRGGGKFREVDAKIISAGPLPGR